ASPLPSDETTPPVTKMYFTGLLLDGGIVCGMSCSAFDAGFDQPAHARQILRCVDANGVGVGLDGGNPEAVLEHAQLLEPLGLFERRGRQRGDPQQELAPVGVEAQVLPDGWLGVARSCERDGCARKVDGVEIGRAACRERVWVMGSGTA